MPDQNRWGAYVAPPLILTYGDPGSGKTDDALRATGAERTLFVGNPKSFAVLASKRGWTVNTNPPWEGGQVAHATTLEHTVATLDWILRKRAEGRSLDYRWVLWDDADNSIMQTLDALKAQHAGHKQEALLVYGEVYKQLRQLTHLLRELDMGCVITMRLSPMNQSKRNRPRVEGKVGKLIIAECTDALAVHQGTAKDLVWRHVYRGQPVSGVDPMYETKSRGELWGEVPMNLREYLRLMGVGLDAPRGWEEILERGAALAAARAAEDGAPAAYLETIEVLVGGGIDFNMAAWAAYDGVCRHLLATALSPASRLDALRAKLTTTRSPVLQPLSVPAPPIPTPTPTPAPTGEPS